MVLNEYDAVVIGAGQAGLGISFFLQQLGRSHIVYERRRIGESWLSQRWDTFQLNTPNCINSLPGYPYQGPEPDGFWTQRDLVAYFRAYIDYFNLPVQTGVNVTEVEPAEANHSQFCVKIESGEHPVQSILSRVVVVASGSQHTPRVPSFQTNLAEEIAQLHSSEYRSAAKLPPGAVVVVGSGQSGCQIAEDLLDDGRKVYLCSSRVGRIPRRYRGRDMMEWMTEMRYFDTSYENLADKSVSMTAQPQISGVGRCGHSVSLQYLASKGAVILGRLVDVQHGELILGDDAPANVRFADEFSQRMKSDVDAYLTQTGHELPPLEEDPADVADPQCGCAYSLSNLSLGQAGVSTVIWSTGFNADFSWLHLPVLDDRKQPVHHSGISPVPGLYFLGFPWLNSRKSGILYGVEDDARRIAESIKEYLG